MSVCIFNFQPRIRNDPNSPSLSQAMSHVVDMPLLFSEFQLPICPQVLPTFLTGAWECFSQTSTFPSSGSTRVLNLEFPVIMLSTRAITSPKNMTMIPVKARHVRPVQVVSCPNCEAFSQFYTTHVSGASTNP